MDVRSLAALRIALAAMILVDLACRARDLAAHYTDSGVLPRAARIAMEQDGVSLSGAWAWSLHMANGTTLGQAVLFLLAALFAVWLLIGYRTRLATVACWVMVVSLYHRTPPLEDAGDTILRCVLFWSMFLPLGAVASVDRRLGACRRIPPRELISLPGAALLLQICMIYWSTAAEKHSPIWFQEYTALYYTLSIDAFATPLGHRMLAYPQLLAWLTMAVCWLEWLGPAAAISPVARGWAGLFVVLAFWSFHFATALTMELGTLPWISMAVWSVFLPGVLWDKLRWRLPSQAIPCGRFAALAQRIFRRPEAAYAPPSNVVCILVAGLSVYVAIWNINRVSGVFEERWRPAWKTPAYLLALEQTWRMFAPYPMTDDGWYEMRGRLADGSLVNLWEPQRPLPRRKPANVAATYRNQRWRKYLMELRSTWPTCIPSFADWLRHRWNDDFAAGSASRRVRHIQIIYHIEETLSPDRSSTLVVPDILFEADYQIP